MKSINRVFLFLSDKTNQPKPTTMKKQSYKHSGFTFTLEYQGAECTEALITKGDFTGSIAMVEDQGHIEDAHGRTRKVSQETLEYFQDMEQEFLDAM